jgi:hypothetical protein
MGLGGGWEANVQLTKDHERQARVFVDAAEEIGANSSWSPFFENDMCGLAHMSSRPFGFQGKPFYWMVSQGRNQVETLGF